MSQTFTLPDLGEGLTEAEIVQWLVAEGDEIAVDQAIVEVETAKSLVELPSPFAGTVQNLHAAAGSTLAVGKPLITVGQVGSAPVAVEVAPEPEAPAGSGRVLIGYGTASAHGAPRRTRQKKSLRTPPTPPPAHAGPTLRGEAPRVVSPIVRALARNAHVNLRSIEPTGAGGVITRKDVHAAIAAATAEVTAVAMPAGQPGSATGERRMPLSGFRRTVAAHLTQSRREIPEATVWVDVDMTALWELRQSGGEGSPGLLAYIARFVVAGLREYPMLNARIDMERNEIVEFEHINLGVAMQTDRGLLVPAVMNAHTLTTRQLDGRLRELTQRARAGKATTPELTEGTFTLNNYGSFNVDGSAPIINYPQVGMLGLGRILDRAWVVNSEICVRKIAQMSFVFDHRVCDGAEAAGFMRSIVNAIEKPASIVANL